MSEDATTDARLRSVLADRDRIDRDIKASRDRMKHDRQDILRNIDAVRAALDVARMDLT